MIYIIVYILLVILGFVMAKVCEEPSMFWISFIPILNLVLVLAILASLIQVGSQGLNKWFKNE